MKLILSLAFIFAANISQAVTVEVIGKSNEVLFSTNEATVVPASLGRITIEIFDAHQVPYVGGDFGINTLFSLGNDMELISDTEMKAHGWCFSIDGEVPETMADHTDVTLQDSKIVWFYAYAHYKDGNWIAQCVKN